MNSNEREPASLKLLRRELSITYDERARMQLQKSIWQIRKEFLADMARQRDHDKVKKGGVLYKSKKLFPICSMQLTEAARNEAGCSSQDTDLQMLEVKHEYQVKWGCHNLQLRSSVSDALNRFDGLGIDISSSDVVCARLTIKKFGKVDHYGVSPRGIWMLASVCSDVVCSFLTRVMSSRQLMESISINGLLFAKARGAILASKTRAILPLPAILTWLDCILFKRLHPFVDSLFPEVESVFIGARPFTQTLDIMHGLQSVIEKGLDAHGQSAIAQMDIRRYYDSIHVLRVFRYLVDRHCDVASAICLLRFHCCPCVLLQFNSVSVPIQSRSIGALTGTRTAGLLGRIPVEDVIQKRHHIWEQFCFKTDSSSLALATYIDNIFGTGSCAEDAVEILKDCELHLQNLWGLSIGIDSKSFMCAQGCSEPDDQTKAWAHEYGNTFKALGHILADNGSIQPCLTATLASMWRAFYGNHGKWLRDATLHTKVRLINRAVLPIASYRMSRWPYQMQAARRIDRTQTKMIGILMGLRFQPGDDPTSFAQRRNRAAGRVARNQGKWSAVWRNRVINWSSHLQRDINANSWAAKTLNYHGKDWLQQQRIIHATNQYSSIFAGRTGTRAAPGIVHKRWHDGVDSAQSV